jgi:hypothetical protein
MSKNELVTRPVEPGAAVPERATRVASWVGWHLFEIAGVAVPAVLAVSVTAWWWLVSGVVGAGWVANEVRVTQARRQPGRLGGLRHGDGSPSTGDVSGETSGVDDTRAGGVR